MCIVLATTAHPSYALIVIDNRDEFITRPTSRPHWWSSQHQQILSSRDLLRAEQGTWLGVTQNGNFAVLTNYREDNTHDPEHPVKALRSRGEMVTTWLRSPNDESTQQFMHHLLEEDGVKGVGGFSLLCGKLRKRVDDGGREIEPLAIISNRSGTPDDVPWIAKRRREVYGLSNTSYEDPLTWPKVEMGKEKILQVVEEAVKADLSKEELIEKLYGILDTNTLPPKGEEEFETYLYQLRNSIFIPAIGQETPASEMPKADQIASANPSVIAPNLPNGTSAGKQEVESVNTVALNGMQEVYGTQRQTIVLVDWDGNVTFKERALYDAEGRSIERGKGDISFEFQIDGWKGESKGIEVHPHAVL